MGSQCHFQPILSALAFGQQRGVQQYKATQLRSWIAPELASWWDSGLTSQGLGSQRGNGTRSPKLLASAKHGGALAMTLSRGVSSGPQQAVPQAAIGFTTRGSRVAGKALASQTAMVTSHRRALPFASMALAAATVSTGAKPAKASTTAEAPAKKKKSLAEIVDYASKKALSGGIPGMVAMALQVCTLMWLRTTINYQYRYGTSTMTALKTLYKEGGIPRFYQGMLPALIQGPLSRFGDTAANTGMLAVLEEVELPAAAKTVAASLAAGAFRIFLMPVDALKTIMQVEGKNGIPSLMAKIQKGGPTVLYHGALAASAATFVGHYPWFAVYNTLNDSLPKYDELSKRLLRSAFIGFCSSFVSDCCSNSIRVIKTAKQTHTTPITYGEVVKTIIAKDGVAGLFGRGLGTKLITNGMQGILFSVLWRLGQDYYAKREKDAADAKAAADKEAEDAAKAAKKKK